MIRKLLTNQKNPEKLAVIENDKEVLYSEIINKALAVQSLLPKGLRENIGIFLPDSGDYIAAFWGSIEAGMTAFPLNVLMTAYELAPLLKYARVEIIISSTRYKSLFEDIAMPLLKIIYMEELDTASYEKGFPADIGPDESAVLLSTSGTTGKYKIVQLSEKNIEASVLGYLDKLRLEKQECRYILAVPFSSIYGIMILSACLIKSFPIIILGPPFTLNAIYLAAEKYRATHYEGSTSAILLMEQTIGKTIPYDISTLTCFGSGGSKVSGNTISKLQEAYRGKEFFHGYGMTEASPLIAKHPLGRVRKTESVGTAIKGIEIAIESDNAIACIPYTKGEILVRGPNVMLGYYNNELETRKVLKNGYLYTGDIGYLDEEGYLYICGRKKNIIIVRGFNVYPEEVEEYIINSQLAIDCVVYGEADDLGNEILCADIVPIHSGIKEEEIRIYCSTHLAEYKQPRRISFCKSIKKNILGKTERRKEDSL